MATSKDFYRCDSHPKDIEFFCKDHNKLCCITCAITTHRGCGEVAEIADIAKSSQADARFRPLKGKMVALKQKINDASALLDSTKEQAKCQFYLLPNELEAARHNILVKFDKLQKQVRTTAKDALNVHVEGISARRCACRGLNNKIHSTIHEYESHMTDGSPVQKFIAIEKLNQLYACLQTEVSENLDTMNLLSFCVELNADVKHVLTAGSVGKILIYTERVNVDPLLYGNCKLTLKKSVELPKGGKGKLPRLSGLTFLPDGRLVAVDHHNGQIILFDSDLHVLATHTIHDRPMAITALNDYDLTVSKGNQLLRYTVDSCNKIEGKGTITGLSKYFSVSSLKGNKYLVGVCDAEKPACVVSKDGVETQLDIKFKQKKYGISDTRCCYSAATDCVILTELSTDTVFIYGQSDRAELEVRDDAIKEPKGVAVNDKGGIFVCSRGNDSIVQISPSGSIISSTQCENMFGPSRVCVHPYGTPLAVANNCSPRCLQIYKIG